MTTSPRRLLFGSPSAAFATTLLIGLTICAVFAPTFVGGGATETHLARQLEAPSSAAWFGTDLLGRDVFGRTLLGIRSSLAIGLLAALVSLVIGVLVGATAGWCGGKIDSLLMRFVDLLYGIPFICLVIFLLAVLRDHEPALRAHGITRETVLYACVGGTTWLTMARLVRNEVARIKSLPYVEAARALGLGDLRTMVRHVLPNAFGVIVVALTLSIPSILQYEAFLSFLGLGIESPGVSLGLLSAEGVEALSPVYGAWWLIAFPGLALALLLLGFSLLGDALRDALDPRTR
jgi:oligopeptide transport system permease protein